jgi:hypothetical protein
MVITVEIDGQGRTFNVAGHVTLAELFRLAEVNVKQWTKAYDKKGNCLDLALPIAEIPYWRKRIVFLKQSPAPAGSRSASHPPSFPPPFNRPCSE